ncbi:MAG: hypothetical protein ACYTFI_17920, partial [Planctomycetota bacterium]
MTRDAKRPRVGMAPLVPVGVLLVAAAACAGEAARGGPVSFWTFDGSLKDAAGDSRDDLAGRGAGGGTCAARFVNATELPGTVGKAAALGVRQGDALFLAAPSSPDVRLPASYTIEAWIHPTAQGEWDRLVL